MKNCIQIALLATISLLPLTLTAQTTNWRAVKDDAATGIVRVHVVYEKKERIKPYREGELLQRSGTGFFVNKHLLVTNQHVIEGAKSIKVEGATSREKFTVRLAATPSLNFDLAVLKFANSEEQQRFERMNGSITPLDWAEWKEAQPGEQVAVLGFGNSEQLVATQGIISSWEAHNDFFQRRLDRVTLIRTDAAVNPGNSGGPVVSAKGRVIGVSARYGPGENVGLLIPFSTAKRVVEVLQSRGEFVKTDPGMVTYNLNPVLRNTLGLAPDQAGLVVSFVTPGSPAHRAGIRQWDVITKVDEHDIHHGEINHPHIGKLPYWFALNTKIPGDVVDFELIRNGEAQDARLSMDAAVRPRIWLPTEGEDYQPEWEMLGGLVISEVTRELLQELEDAGNWRWDLVNDAPLGGKIYMVTNIEPGTQAASYSEYGLDLYHQRVVAINGKPLRNNLKNRVADIYYDLTKQTAPTHITVEFENHLSIQLNTPALINDRITLTERYPLLQFPSARTVYPPTAQTPESEEQEVSAPQNDDSVSECAPLIPQFDGIQFGSPDNALR